MMELQHVAMVNWHLFDVEYIELTGHTGVFGENRSGKSTILDMAQVVLTGGNRNVQRLNAVAGDKGRSRSASKRSVVDYCLGALGEDQRDKAIDYVREYMRRLVPHASVVGEQNANSLQKAVVNAMTLDHDQTATEFVRNYILEKNNIKVGELRESIRTYRNITETIKTMREKLEALLTLRLIVDELAGAHERKACEQWIAKR